MLIAPDATTGAPALVVVVAAVLAVVAAGCVSVLARGLGLGLRFGVEFEFGGRMSVAAEAEMGGKEVEVAVEAEEAGSVLLDEREFQLVVLRSAMDYAAIGIGDNSSRYSVVAIWSSRWGAGPGRPCSSILTSSRRSQAETVTQCAWFDGAGRVGGSPSGVVVVVVVETVAVVVSS